MAARRKTRERLAWTACAAAAALAALFAVGFFRRTPKEEPMTRFQIEAPPDLSFVGNPRISPNGRIIAFRAVDQAGEAQIWLRPLDSIEARSVPGTESITNFRPIWSPDGERFLLLSPLESQSNPPTKVVLNWEAALRR